MKRVYRDITVFFENINTANSIRQNSANHANISFCSRLKVVVGVGFWFSTENPRSEPEEQICC